MGERTIRAVELKREMGSKDPLIWLLDNPIHVDPKKIREIDLNALDDELWEDI